MATNEGAGQSSGSCAGQDQTNGSNVKLVFPQLQPLALLRSIDGLEIVRHHDAAMCCGSAGSYSLTEVELSRDVLRKKIAALLAAAPDVVATGNPGCIMQIGAGLAAAGHEIPVVHPIEILDRSYYLAGFYDS